MPLCVDGVFLPMKVPSVGLFIHSPADGHLGCFRLIVVTEKAAVNVFCTVLGESKHSFPLRVFLRVELLGQRVSMSSRS